MGKVQYASIFAVMATVVLALVCYIWPKVKENSRNVHIMAQLIIVFCMDVLYFTSFFTIDVKYLMVNHILVQAFEVAIAYMYCDFVVKYGQSKLKKARNLMRTLVVLDIIMLLADMFGESFFRFHVSRNGMDIYVNPIANGWYIVHLGITVWLLFIFIFSIYKKMFLIAHKYRMKYFVLNIILLIGTILCAVVRSVGYFTNFPSVMLMSVGVCVTFYLFYYIPNCRYNEMKNFAIKNVTSPIFMFDDEDRLEFINEPASKLMSVEKGLSLDDFIDGSNLKYILAPDRRKTGKTKEFTLTIEYMQMSFLVHGQELWDSQGSFVGTLLVYNDISKQEKLKSEATYHATRDMLTGLWNREFFLEIAQRTINDHPENEFVMIVSDISQFKMFNDILGKKMGDDLLLTIANSLNEYEKAMWITARVGGDSFAVLMPADDFEETRFIERCDAAINERKYKIHVEFSLGVYYIKDNKVGVYDIYDRALMALESIKRDNDKVIAYYDESIRERKISQLANND